VQRRGDVFAVMLEYSDYSDLSENYKYSRNNVLFDHYEGGLYTMANTDKPGACCPPANITLSCCKVEAIVTVDERGQMVLPKELRDRAYIRTGEKLAVVSWEKDGNISCISLIKAEDLTEMVKNKLGPVMKEIL
jgi:antitoxin PrlF